MVKCGITAEELLSVFILFQSWICGNYENAVYLAKYIASFLC